MGEKEAATYDHLPHPLSRFIGREGEMVQVRGLLAETRLLTLTGSGGSGKTRLAIQTASGLADEYPGGIWLVELSELSDPAFIQQTVASTLGLHKEPGRPLLETLVAWLKPRRVLLVLDNCEHLIDACAQLAQTLLSSCLKLKILATSREPLQIPGEITWQVLPLSLPDPNRRLSPREAGQSEAVQLFLDRAHSKLPGFSITQQNADEIVQICRRLDGIPLALELAAAWVNLLSPKQINERLDRSLDFLVYGSRAVPRRQQTLRAVLDWSYDLLSDSEKVLFRRLALFMGDFSLRAAEAICSGSGEGEEDAVINLLSQLASKSLVWIDQEDDQGKRFRLLEMVRQYSLEKWRASEDEDCLSDRFLDYFLSVAEKANSEIGGLQQRSWVAILERELSHFRTALSLSQERASRIEKGLRLACSLTQFWQLRGYLSEGSRWLEELLACSPDEPSEARALALDEASFLAFFLEDYDRSKNLAEEARDIYLNLGDEHDATWSVNRLANIALALGDFAQANYLAEQSLVILRGIDDPMGISISLLCIGDVAFLQNDLARAESSVEESLELCRRIGNNWAAARRLARLGQLALIQGHSRQALDYLKEGLTMARDAGDKWGIVMNLAGMAELAIKQGQAERAARLLAGAQTVLEVFSTRLWTVDRVLYENCEAAVIAWLGEPAYQEIYQEMHARSLEQIVEYALAGPDQTGSDSLLATERHPSHTPTPLQESKQKYDGLTAREREVATLVAQGKSNASIAEELFVGVRTVEAHITRILLKLNFSSRTQIAGWAIGKGLALPPE